MPRRRTRAPSILFASLAAIPATAAAGPGNPPQVCTAPTSVAECQAPGYLLTTCGAQHFGTCQQLGEAKAGDPAYYPAGTDFAAPGFDPDLPLSQQPTLYRLPDYAPDPLRVLDAATGTTLLGGLTAAAAGLAAKPPTLPAGALAHIYFTDTWRQHPEYEANGEQIDSCAEYAYEKYYDLARFLEATMHCQGDPACRLDVALWGFGQSGPAQPPGVANRTLVRKDGKPVGSVIGAFPAKNPFFSIGEAVTELVVADAADPHYALYSHVHRGQAGQSAAGVGAPMVPANPGVAGLFAAVKQPEEYPDSWTWTAAVVADTKKVSAREWDEYRRRVVELAEMFEILELELHKHPDFSVHFDLVNQAPIDLGIWEQAQGPEMKVMSGKARMPGFLGALRALGGRLRPVLTPPLDTRNIRVTSLSLRKLAPELADLLRLDEVGLYLPEFCPAIDPKARDFFGRNPTVIAHYQCRIMARLDQEYQRWLEGKPSCLDPQNQACDLAPLPALADRITARVLEQFSEPAEAAYAECQKWSNGEVQVFGDAAARADLGAFEAAMKEFASEMDAVVATVPKLEPTVFGESLAGGELFGEKGSFSAFYNYDLGWSVHPVGVVEVGGVPKVCQIGAEAHAKLHVGATTPFDGNFVWEEFLKSRGLKSDMWNKIVYADFSTRANMPQDPLQPHGGGDGLLWAKAHLVVTGNELIPPLEASVQINTVYTKPIVEGKYKTSLISATWWIGPVPITVDLTVEARYGAEFIAETKMPTDCDPDNQLFKAEARLRPWVFSTGRASAGVGVPGLSIGVRAKITLLDAEAVAKAGVYVENFDYVNDDGTAIEMPHIFFEMGATMTLSTLGGELVGYIEYVLDTAEAVFWKWNGFGPYKLQILKLVSQKFPLYLVQVAEDEE